MTRLVILAAVTAATVGLVLLIVISTARPRASNGAIDRATRTVGADPSTADLVGTAAPDFSLGTLAGGTVRLSDLRGKVVLLDFWATWCAPCRESLPHLQEMGRDKSLADKGLVVLAVNAQEDPAQVAAFVRQKGFTFTVPMDPQATAAAAYHVYGLPATVVVGRDGKVAKIFVSYGPDNPAEIKAAVEKALAEGNPAA